MLEPNQGKLLERTVQGRAYLRLPIKTRLITNKDTLPDLVREYVLPHAQQKDVIFISEKIVATVQDRIIPIASVHASRLAQFLSDHVDNKRNTKEFRGYGHGTPEGMQLFIEEAGVLRVLFAAFVAALTKPFGIKGMFYRISGKLAKSVDCPMSWDLEPYTRYAKRAPLHPDRVARELRDLFGYDTVIVDANYIGAFSLGKSNRAISESFIQEVLRDNPAGQGAEMTPFFIIRAA